VRVVERLEAVEVGDQDEAVDLVAHGQRPLSPEVRVKGPPVGDPGERVDVGELGEDVLLRAQAGDLSAQRSPFRRR